MKCFQHEAAILVGGLGTRLKSVIPELPKPLAPIRGRPFVEWLLRDLAKQGVRRAVLCVGYRAEDIRRELGSGVEFGLELVYSEETEPLGTGGAVRQALDRFRGDGILIANGDSWCGARVAELERAWEPAGVGGVLWVAPVADTSRFGSIEVDPEGWVMRFREKEGRGAGWVNGGVALVDKALLEARLPASAASRLEQDFFAKLGPRTLRAVLGSIPVVDIGTPSSYASAATSLETLGLLPAG